MQIRCLSGALGPHCPTLKLPDGRTDGNPKFVGPEEKLPDRTVGPTVFSKSAVVLLMMIIMTLSDLNLLAMLELT